MRANPLAPTPPPRTKTRPLKDKVFSSNSGEVIQNLVPRAADSKRESITLSSLFCPTEANTQRGTPPFHTAGTFVQEGLEKTKETENKGKEYNRSADKLGSESECSSEPIQFHHRLQNSGESQPPPGRDAPAVPASLGGATTQAGSHRSTSSPLAQSAWGQGPSALPPVSTGRSARLCPTGEAGVLGSSWSRGCSRRPAGLRGQFGVGPLAPPPKRGNSAICLLGSAVFRPDVAIPRDTGTVLTDPRGQPAREPFSLPLAARSATSRIGGVSERTSSCQKGTDTWQY